MLHKLDLTADSIFVWEIPFTDITVKPHVLLMETLQTSAGILVFWLTV